MLYAARVLLLIIVASMFSHHSTLAGAATQIAIASGDQQTAVAGSPVSSVVCVIATGASSLPVAGVTITFGNITGGGSITGANQLTNSNGIATLGSWTLGASPGINTLTASAAGLNSVTFTATGSASVPPPAPSQFDIATGNNQSAPAGTAVPNVVCVIVRDANANPLSGIQVNWGSVTGGGSITGTSQLTDAAGIATLGSWTLGSTPGTNTVTATTAGLTPLVFVATGTAPASNVAIVTGNNQTAPAGSSVPNVVCVAVTNSNGTPVSGITVIWGNVTGGGNLVGEVQQTDSSGLATLGGWTLGPYSGVNTITASAPGTNSVTFSATSIGPPPLFASPPLSPPPANAGDVTTFSAMPAPSSANAVLTWDFDDGTSATGTSVQHVFASPGIYQVKAILNDGVNSTSVVVNVIINAIGTVSGNGVFAVLSGNLKFAFTKLNRDQIVLSGTVPVPSGFSPAGKTISIAIGGLQISRQLNARGSTPDKSLVLRGTLKSGALTASPAKFAFNWRMADVFGALQGFGFNDANVNPPGKQVSVPVIFSVDGIGYLYSATFDYTAKLQKTGTATLKK